MKLQYLVHLREVMICIVGANLFPSVLSLHMLVFLQWLSGERGSKSQTHWDSEEIPVCLLESWLFPIPQCLYSCGKYCLLSSVLQWERRNNCAMNSSGSGKLTHTGSQIFKYTLRAQVCLLLSQEFFGLCFLNDRNWIAQCATIFKVSLFQLCPY